MVLLIGLCQCFALWPGFSCSASTIVGGLFLGLSRKAAAEISFFAAVPVLFPASAVDIWSNRSVITPGNLPILLTELGVSFIAALFAVRWFVHFVSTRTMAQFGWYRIAIGALLLLYLVVK